MIERAKRAKATLGGAEASEASQVGEASEASEPTCTIYQRNITISATQVNKNTTLQCIGSRNGEVAISNSATFMVQGRSWI